MSTAWATESPNPVTATREQWAGRESLLKRAERREVTQLTDDAWRVQGVSNLGDTYPEYEVTISNGRYACSCYLHGGGEVRARKVCSHVLGVILWRKKRKAVELARVRVAGKREERGSTSPVLLAPSEQQPAPNVQGCPSIPDPSDEMFGGMLPEWVESFRPDQWKAIEQIVDAFRQGNKVVFAQAPTGAGKSLIGETVRLLLGVRGIYVCTTKALQAQFIKDFPHAHQLMGRANYPTLGGATVNLWGEHQNVDGRGRTIEVTCADCTRTQGSDCRWCSPQDSCPYRIAKQLAAGGDLAVLNTSYWLTDANKGAGVFGAKRPRGLVVVDEADCLEGELMGQIEVHIGKRTAKRLGIEPPKRKTVESAWVDWVGEEAMPKVIARLKELGPLGSESHGPREIREVKQLTNLYDGLRTLAVELPQGGWVYDGYAVGDMTFKPVSVSKFGKDWIWRHGDRFLLMSATIISAQQMADDLGLDGDYAVVDVPMGFPKENRPVRVCAVAEMTRRNEVEATPKIAKAAANIVKMREGKRVLVHTVSYKLADAVFNKVREVNPGRPVYRYLDSQGKGRALELYLEHEGAVLIAPSMDRGVDLPNEACEVQVICKLPYPNMGDKQVNARMHTAGGSNWFAMLTARSLVQMCGRGVRHKDDYAETFLLDHSFTSNFWRRNRALLPKWWIEALDWRFDVRSIL